MRNAVLGIERVREREGEGGGYLGFFAVNLCDVVYFFRVYIFMGNII